MAPQRLQEWLEELARRANGEQARPAARPAPVARPEPVPRPAPVARPAPAPLPAPLSGMSAAVPTPRRGSTPAATGAATGHLRESTAGLSAAAPAPAEGDLRAALADPAAARRAWVLAEVLGPCAAERPNR